MSDALGHRGGRSAPGTAGAEAFRLRTPEPRDAARILSLVREGGVLEENSCYAYLLLTTHFAETCVVAEEQGRLAGFVAAYRLPARPDVLFVWQIGVATFARRKGLGLRMLDHVVRRPGNPPARWLETTVTPSNEASRALFASLAATLRAGIADAVGFVPRDFLPEQHEAERLLRIGPLSLPERERSPVHGTL